MSTFEPGPEVFARIVRVLTGEPNLNPEPPSAFMPDGNVAESIVCEMQG